MKLDRDLSGTEPLRTGHVFVRNITGAPIRLSPSGHPDQHGREVETGGVFQLPSVDAREWRESGLVESMTDQEVAEWRKENA